MIADDIAITKKIPQHQRGPLARKVKQLNEVADEISLTKIIPQYLQEGLKKKGKGII